MDLRDHAAADPSGGSKGLLYTLLKRLPDVSSLAGVSHDELMKLWQGLGYYSRANNLQRAAIQIMEEYGGSFPEHYEEILTLPGIGEYTAGAIASIAFGEAVPAIDGNVYRIYTRLCGDDSDITKHRLRRNCALSFPMPSRSQNRAAIIRHGWILVPLSACQTVLPCAANVL